MKDIFPSRTESKILNVLNESLDIQEAISELLDIDEGTHTGSIIVYISINQLEDYCILID